MKKNRIISIIITLLIIMGFCIPSSVMADETIIPGETTVTTEAPPEGNPSFILSRTQYYKVEAGKTTTLEIRLDNVSYYSCKTMNATIKDEKGVFKFPTTNIFTERSIPYNSGRYLYIDLEVPKTVPAGTYPLTIDLLNVNYDYVSSNQSLTFYVEVVNSLNINGIEVTNYNIDKNDIKAGDLFNITATVKNNTGIDIKNAKVSLDGLDGNKFAMNSGLSNLSVDLKNGEEKALKFSVVGCAGISSIREVIPLKISYYLNPDNKDSKQESETNITISCKKTATTDSDSKTFAPNIIIEKYDFGGQYVVGGKTFPLSLSLKNTSKNAQIQNLKVTIQGVQGDKEGGIAFSPANSSNSFFFEKLNADSSTEIKLDMLPKADAKPDSYPIQVTFDYEYIINGKKDKAETKTETITIPLQQEDRFVVNAVQIQSDSSIGQECPINVTLVNKGKSSVYNVSVDVEGEGFDKTSTTYYIGNVDSGKEEYYDATIIPNTEGEIKGNIVVTYEDANGNEKTVKQEFMTKSTQMVVDPGMNGGEVNVPVDGKPVQSGLPLWATILIIAGGTAAVVTGVIITVKLIKKKNKLKAEKEDDNEDI